jgi:hypothetical protein
MTTQRNTRGRIVLIIAVTPLSSLSCGELGLLPGREADFDRRTDDRAY